MSKNLNIHDRKYIADCLKQAYSKTKIAKGLAVSVSTVCREVQRNSRRSGIYDPVYAQKIAIARKKRVGSMVKRKAIKNRKKAYVLYADRRYIFWFSDEYYKRKERYSFFSTLGDFYRSRLCKKKFHYYEDASLFFLLFLHEGWSFPTTVDVLYERCLPQPTELPLFYHSPQKWLKSVLPKPSYRAVA